MKNIRGGVQRMSKDSRREQIVELVSNSREMSNSELSRLFGVTEETIRKDVSFLSEQGLLVRTFGGASSMPGRERPLSQRNVAHYEEKQKIARKALEFIGDNESIAMDSGSTVVSLARCLKNDSGLVVVTNALEILNIMSGMHGVMAISSGGNLRPKSMTFTGRAAEESMASYNIQKYFMSAEAIDLALGVMDAGEAEVLVKRKLIASVKETYLLADHSKFQTMAHITTCPVSDITTIITDDAIDERILKAYRDAGANVVVAE